MSGKAETLTDDKILQMFLQGWSKDSLIKQVKTANEVTLPAAKGLVERTIYRYQMEEMKKSVNTGHGITQTSCS